MGELDDLRIVEAIYDALDRTDPERALSLALDALDRSEREDPVVRFLAGVALLEMGKPGAAVDELRRAAELDPEDAEFRARLALALFRRCSFEEARAEARRALEADESLADGHEVSALLLERRGSLEEADRHLARAHELDPERFPCPIRLTRQEFEREVALAGERLPEDFRRHLAQVAVTVEEFPSDAVLLQASEPLDPELLGLFVGVALSERSSFSTGGELPPRILLFQRNLERYAADPEELREEIVVTLYHELGHYLGLDEDELEELDLA